MAVDVNLIEKYIEEGLNILITGQAGTGKTTMLQAAVKNLGWRMKYYSTATLDPLADLIGIPVPDRGRQTVDYYRPRDLDKADVVFFDELNRADLMVLNAVFEIIQFRSINGEKLDNLKCVVAAINPVEDGYATRELDTALKDRFDLYLESDPNPSPEYFQKRYGDEYATAGLRLYQEYQELRESGQPLGYFSPRRLDKMLAIYQKFPVTDSIRGVVPEGGQIDFQAWSDTLKESLGGVTSPISEDLGSRITHARKYLRSSYAQNDFLKGEILNAFKMAHVSRNEKLPVLQQELVISLGQTISSPDDIEFWSFFITAISDEEFEYLTKDWTPAKRAKALQCRPSPA